MVESHAIISQASHELEQDAFRRFSPQYFAALSREGLLARALVARELEHIGIVSPTPCTDTTGAPLPIGGIHWSIAHKGNMLAAVLSKCPVGIDIEHRVERDTCLFSFITEGEWNRLGERSWDAFYMLWTAKEALIKKKRLALNVLPSITLLSRHGTTLLLQYHHSPVPIRCVSTAEYICSYTL